MKSVNLVLGTMTFGERIFGSQVTEMIRYYLDQGYAELDTAYVYNNGESELLVGEAIKDIGRNALKIATKINPRITGKLDGQAAYMQLNGSLERMRTDYVDILYLHFPDANTPIDSVLEACADMYQQGKFREFGLSNFPAWLVTDVFYRCKENGWMLPTVYEGLYNPLSRRAENELDLCLRTLGIRFNAYNPLAGGILTDKYKNFKDAPLEGRFTNRPNYQKRYWKETYFEAADMLKKVCQEYNLTIVEATYRWLAYHSMLDGDRGDSILIGASKLEHLEQNISALNKGKLPDEIKNVFEETWKVVCNDAPDYFRFYGTVG